MTVVCNLETGEPLWFGRERKKETKALAIAQDLNDPRQIGWAMKALGDLQRLEAAAPTTRNV